MSITFAKARDAILLSAMSLMVLGGVPAFLDIRSDVQAILVKIESLDQRVERIERWQDLQSATTK